MHITLPIESGRILGTTEGLEMKMKQELKLTDTLVTLLSLNKTFWMLNKKQ